MRNTPKSLNEELMKMRKLMNFDISENSHDVLSENFVKKSTISEQTESETVEVSVVENCFGYADDTSVFNVLSYTPLMKWWCTNKNKDGVDKSKEYWAGSGSKGEKMKNSHNKVLSNLDFMISNEKFSEFKVPFTKLKEKLEKLKSEKIYISTRGFGRVGKWIMAKQDLGLDNLLDKDGELNSRLLGTGAAKIKSFIKNYIGDNGNLVDTKFMKTVSTGYRRGESLLKGDVTMSDQDKINILNQLTTKVEDHFSRKGKTMELEKGIQKAKSIILRPKAGQQITKTDIIPDTEPQTMTQKLTYPNIDGGERLPENVTMFGDDEFKLKPAAKDNLENLLKEGIKSITSQNGKITKISYGSAASTSKVRTKFGGVGEDGNALRDKDKSSADNNIPLVKARIGDINTTIRNLIDNNDTLSNVEDLEIIQGENLEMPNEGPSWLTNNGKYGQLYNKAYLDDKNLTPRKFYTRDNKAIRDEYNSVFQRYRMSYGYIKIEFEIQDSSEEPSVEYAVAGDWKILIKWKESSITLPRIPSMKGGSGLVDTKLSVGCPKPLKGWWSNYMVNGK
jgi:hypothetical protein